MRRQRVASKSVWQIPSERSRGVTVAVYHGKTMTITAQRAGQSFRAAAHCRSNTEGLAVSRDCSDLTFIARVRR